jgi:single-stranded-DNA-specific exonuclease
MLKPKTRWVFQQAEQEKIDRLVAELQITPLVASLLVNRGLEGPDEAKSFLYDDGQQFHDPFLFEGMELAVSRIREAIENSEPILIFGDYDADGVTSTSVMMTTLRELGANVQFYIPNRFTEGYGPNAGAFQHAAENGIRLVITVDTGIAAVDVAKQAHELGMDLIITDHHEPGPVLPQAYAIIHPKLNHSSYPFRDLAGVGVAFKLAHALYGKVPVHLLDLVAIGTIADLVPLRGENRLIAKKGINKLKTTERIGLKSLMKQSNVDPSTVDEETIGYVIAPRINAVGRLDSADPAVHLLLSNDSHEADMIAEEIEQLNKERQSIVTSMTEEATKEVEEHFPIEENSVIVVGKQGWNSGVVGIVASKLVERFYRPAIVLSYDEEKGLAKGSARSIVGFDLFQNLSTCRDILPHFGGHPMAAGMTLQLSNVDDLRQRLNQLAREQLTEEDFIPVTTLDCEAELKDIHLDAIEEMQLLAPFGMSNPKPKILIKETQISQMKKIGANQNHLKVVFEEQGYSLDGVGFGLGHLFEEISPSSKLSVMGELAINEWNHIRKPQIFLQDIGIQDWQLFDYRGLKHLERLKEMIPKGKWVFFNKENYTKFYRDLAKEPVMVESLKQAKELNITYENVILADLPPSSKYLVSLFTGKSPSRIYVHFYNEKSDYFSTMPTREHFKWFYGFLSKKAPFNIVKYGHDLAKYRGWTEETIDFMSKVFIDLEFVFLENGWITLNKTPSKKDLSDSIIYQEKQAHLELESNLLYSSYEQLKNWFDKMIQGSVKIEEAAEEWI